MTVMCNFYFQNSTYWYFYVKNNNVYHNKMTSACKQNMIFTNTDVDLIDTMLLVATSVQHKVSIYHNCHIGCWI